MTIVDLKNALGGQCRSADEIARALGRTPGKKWQRALRRALRPFAIAPQLKRINGQRRRVYDPADFEADANGYVRGTPQVLQRLSQRAEREREALTIRTVMEELHKTYRALRDEPGMSNRERFRQIGLSISYWLAGCQPRD